MQKECLALCDSIHLSYMNNSAAETELRYKDERLEFERYRSSVRQNVIAEFNLQMQQNSD